MPKRKEIPEESIAKRIEDEANKLGIDIMLSFQFNIKLALEEGNSNKIMMITSVFNLYISTMRMIQSIGVKNNGTK